MANCRTTRSNSNRLPARHARAAPNTVTVSAPTQAALASRSLTNRGIATVAIAPPKRYLMHDCKRAGNPHCVAWWAKCSVDGKYSSWFVGGGSPFARGRCRKPTEGTWGLDYNGFFGHAKVWMNYTRYNRNQGGEGAYETDGEPAFVSKAHQILHLGH